MAETYLGENIKNLGFGLMRLPKIGDDVDIEQVKKMVDVFMSKGFTYFDTAYVYDGGKSERALGEAVVKRYPRDSFVCASKLPLWDLKDREGMEKMFEESLERASLTYFDFYLLHAMGKDRAQKVEEVGAWDFLKDLKAQGRIRHMGFSFHDSPGVLDDILTKHPEAEFVQLQINYADWDSESVQSRACYEVARKHGKPVVIMEPVKGGSLATMTPEIQELFKKARPDLSVASWGIRFAASLPGLVTVLSGMSSLEQLNDNVSYMENFEPLSEEEHKVIDKAVEILRNIPTIPCTACRYCVDGCPQRINIPGIFSTMNNLSLYNNEQGAKRSYSHVTEGRGKASDCLQCGNCEAHCPQHIHIIETLKKAASVLEQ